MQTGSLSPIQLAIKDIGKTQLAFDYKYRQQLGAIAPPLLSASTSMSVILLFLTGCLGGGGSSGLPASDGQDAGGGPAGGQGGEQSGEQGAGGLVLPDLPDLIPAKENPNTNPKEINRQFTVDNNAKAANGTQLVQYEENAAIAIAAINLTPAQQGNGAEDRVSIDKGFADGPIFSVLRTI